MNFRLQLATEVEETMMDASCGEDFDFYYNISFFSLSVIKKITKMALVICTRNR